MNIVERATEIVLDRLKHYEDFQAALAKSESADMDLRKEFENVIYSESFDAAFQDFVGRRGEEEFYSQAQKALNRSRLK